MAQDKTYDNEQLELFIINDGQLYKERPLVTQPLHVWTTFAKDGWDKLQRTIDNDLLTPEFSKVGAALRDYYTETEGANHA